MRRTTWIDQRLHNCSRRISVASVATVVGCVSAFCVAGPPAADDGYLLSDRFEVYGDIAIPGDEQEHPTTGREMIVIDRTRPVALFAMYRARQMTAPGWDLYNRCVTWANNNADPATTKV